MYKQDWLVTNLRQVSSFQKVFQNFSQKEVGIINLRLAASLIRLRYAYGANLFLFKMQCFCETLPQRCQRFYCLVNISVVIGAYYLIVIATKWYNRLSYLAFCHKLHQIYSAIIRLSQWRPLDRLSPLGLGQHHFDPPAAVPLLPWSRLCEASDGPAHAYWWG